VPLSYSFAGPLARLP